MAEVFAERPADPARDRNEIFAAILLGIAATLTAVASFMASGQDGKALAHFSRSIAQLNDANFYYNKANSQLVEDSQIYNDYRSALIRGETGVADYLRSDMSEQLTEAVDWAEEQGGDATPWDDGSPYDAGDEDGVEADAAQDKADAEFKAAGAAGDKGDQFGLSTILFALTLFFGGISTLIQRPGITRALLAMGVLALGVGLIKFVFALLA